MRIALLAALLARAAFAGSIESVDLEAMPAAPVAAVNVDVMPAAQGAAFSPSAIVPVTQTPAAAAPLARPKASADRPSALAALSIWAKRLAPAVLLPVAVAAQGGELTVGAGFTHFNKARNGIWYQEGYPHHLDLNSPSLSVGYETDKVGAWQFGARVLYLGHASSNATAVALDADYDLKTNRCISPCWPVSHWRTSGDVWGVEASARRDITDSWFGEFGVYAYRPSMRLSVPDWRDSRTGPSEPIRKSYYAPTQCTPMLGVGYRIDREWTVELSAYRITTNSVKSPAIYNRGTVNVTVERSIP